MNNVCVVITTTAAKVEIIYRTSVDSTLTFTLTPQILDIYQFVTYN